MVSSLLALRPRGGPGIRVEPGHRLHLTLHFLGETGPAVAAAMTAALTGVDELRFTIDLEGVGHFPDTGHGTILWAGVRENAALRRLHQAVAAVLAPLGYRPEERPYSPHLTLARCASSVPQSVLAEFQRNGAGFRESGIPVTEFGLYASISEGGVAVYRREAVFPLPPAEETPAE